MEQGHESLFQEGAELGRLEQAFDQLVVELEPMLEEQTAAEDRDSFFGSRNTPDLEKEGVSARFSVFTPSDDEAYSPSILYQELAEVTASSVIFRAPAREIFLRKRDLETPEEAAKLLELKEALDKYKADSDQSVAETKQSRIKRISRFAGRHLRSV